MNGEKEFLESLKALEERINTCGEKNPVGGYTLKTEKFYCLTKKYGELRLLMLNKAYGPDYAKPLGLFIYNNSHLLRVMDEEEINKAMDEFYKEFQ